MIKTGSRVAINDLEKNIYQYKIGQKGGYVMMYTYHYQSPLGVMLLAADEVGLVGLWFEGQKYFAYQLGDDAVEQDRPIFKQTKKWLDTYFSGKNPDFDIPIHFIGTAFQKDVWNILRSIPYGKTMTYGEIAVLVAKKRNITRMSAQAVGGAIGHNKISVIIPCHRVVGTNGNLTGYAGGIDKKIQLLTLEGAFRKNFYIPKKDTCGRK